MKPNRLAMLCPLALCSALSFAATTTDPLNASEAQYKATKKQAAATEKSKKKACEGLKGAEEHACKKQADAAEDKTKADAKMVHETQEAQIRAKK